MSILFFVGSTTSGAAGLASGAGAAGSGANGSSACVSVAAGGGLGETSGANGSSVTAGNSGLATGLAGCTTAGAASGFSPPADNGLSMAVAGESFDDFAVTAGAGSVTAGRSGDAEFCDGVAAAEEFWR